MKYYEFTGKTVDEAIELGLKELNVAREDVEITVLEEGKKKLFGSVKAKVQIGVNEVSEETETAVTAEESVAEEVTEEVANEVVETTTPCDCKNDGATTDGARAVAFLNGLFEVLNINADVTLVKEAEKIEINVNAPNTTKIIGKHGETIDAIQTLASAVANTGRDKYVRVVVDCENYRENREATLEKLAENLAQKAIRLQKKVQLEPMNPYERRIIHSKLSDYEGVKTVSEGKEPNRYIVVIPDNLEDPDAPAISVRRDDRRGGNDRNRGGNRGGNRNGGSRGGNGNRGGYNKKPYNRGGNGGSRSGNAGGTTLKNSDFFGTFLGNSGNKD